MEVLGRIRLHFFRAAMSSKQTFRRGCSIMLLLVFEEISVGSFVLEMKDKMELY